MPDNSEKRAADRKRIDVSQEQECRYWARKLGVSPGELKSAVDAVGSAAEDVAQHLSKSGER